MKTQNERVFLLDSFWYTLIFMNIITGSFTIIVPYCTDITTHVHRYMHGVIEQEFGTFYVVLAIFFVMQNIHAISLLYLISKYNKYFHELDFNHFLIRTISIMSLIINIFFIYTIMLAWPYIQNFHLATDIMLGGVVMIIFSIILNIMVPVYWMFNIPYKQFYELKKIE